MWKTIQHRLYQGVSHELLLILLTMMTIWVSNSPFSTHYWSLVAWPIQIGPDWMAIAMPLSKWVKNGAMTVFFFLVAMEIKRELLDGHLTGIKKALAPLLGAIGGMVVPACIYLAVNWDGHRHGWAIPTATDIAFALACISLLGRRVPAAIKVLLVSIAIVDDLGAIAIVAIGYGSGLGWGWAGMGVAVAIIGAFANRWVSSPWVYAGLCIVSWLAWFKAGISPTLAGVMMAFCVPYTGHQGQYHRIENRLASWSHRVVLPLFILTHAGVALTGSLWQTVATRECLGVMMGLWLGKPLGIVGTLIVGQSLGVIHYPPMGWKRMLGVGCLAGIGFTMSLFITHLAFQDPGLMARAQLGVLLGSCCSAMVGGVLLWQAGRDDPRPQPLGSPTGVQSI